MRGVPELLLSVFGLLGNLGTIAIVASDRKLRRQPNHLLISALSITDAVYCTSLIWFYSNNLVSWCFSAVFTFSERCVGVAGFR